MNTISCRELKERIERGAVVIDVMTPEDYACCHLAGARSACIYEMAFMDHINNCGVSPEAEVVVYDATGTTLAAPTAAGRLKKAGYEKVLVLDGGLAAWRAAGLPVETGAAEAFTGPEPADGRYRVDTERSRLEWIGRNFNNRHTGRISVREGVLAFEGGVPAGGTLVLDMNTIENFDLTDPAWHDLLIRHLKSEDFFHVERFPTATFTLSRWDIEKGRASGDLTIRDVTREVTFPAQVQIQEDGSVKAHAAFDIDRTQWNVNYGSTRLFERLGMHQVHDLITLELFIVAVR
ncbi:YceI family protein [Geomesophilobacter sediminis]|uniref:YceI family protein n=1 Tax=Geomesophilobacter sediminis TaxID=2798584 RepID=UPI002E2D2E22|nr:YceI family protein [Geomesophilobacter sediminis]